MSTMSWEDCRIRDGVWDSKIRWDTPSMLKQRSDTFPPKSSQTMAWLRHNQTRDDHQVRRDFPRVAADEVNKWGSHFQNIHHEYGKSDYRNFKFVNELPTFDGSSLKLDLFEWGDAIEDFFAEMNPSEALKCEIAASRLKGTTCLWWKQIQDERFMEGKNPISSWSIMRKLLISKFEHTSCSIKFPVQPVSNKHGQKELLHVKLKPVSPKSGGIDLSDVVIKPNIHDNTKMILKETVKTIIFRWPSSGINTKQEGEDCEGSNKDDACSKERTVYHESNDVQITKVAISDSPFSTLDVKQESGTEMAEDTMDDIIMPTKCLMKLPPQLSSNNRQEEQMGTEKFELEDAPTEPPPMQHMSQLGSLNISTPKESHEGEDTKSEIGTTVVETPILVNIDARDLKMVE